MYRVSPRVDLAFKKIFGVEENKDLLISLINSIVSEADQVAEVTILNPYNLQNFATEKLSIVDIKAISHTGKRFNIEIQLNDTADYDKRALYYWAKLYTDQLKTSEDYKLLNKAIGIHILNFDAISDLSHYHNIFNITEKSGAATYFTDLELHTIELPKFISTGHAELAEVVAKVKSSLDIWLAFLTRHLLLRKENLPQEFASVNLKKALTVLEVMNFNDLEREIYEGHIKWLMDEASALGKRYEQGVAAGKAAGIAAGKAEGIAAGKAEGIAAGKAEGIAEGHATAIKTIVAKMLAKNYKLTAIADLTGVDIAKINAIVTELAGD